MFKINLCLIVSTPENQMNNIVLITLFIINISINSDPSAITGEYWSVDRNITAVITQDKSNSLTIQFFGLNKDSIKYQLFPLDTEFLRWFLMYFGNINIRKQMTDKKSAFSVKAMDLLSNKTNEPEKMIKKWMETFFKLKNMAD